MVRPPLQLEGQQLLDLLRVYLDHCRHLRIPARVEGFAEHSGRTTRHLYRVFQRVLGRSVHDVFHELQVERAMDLIEKSDLTPQEIAIQCGCGSVWTLARAFKKVRGESLTKYLDQVRQGLR